MKRGFLKNKSIGASSKSLRDAESQPSKPVFTSLSYGVVKEAGKPEGYEAEDPKIGELDATLLDHRDGQVLYTSFPLHRIGETKSDNPSGWCYALCDGPTKKKVLTQPGFPKPLLQPKKKLYQIGPSPLGGLGMFATANISMGDLVLSERPLMLTPKAGPTYISAHIKELPKHFTEEQTRQAMMFEYEKNLKALLERMEKEDQDIFLALHNCHLHDGSGPILGVIRTNGFFVTNELTFMKDYLGLSVEHAVYTAVCKDMSRINHSCRPNITRKFDLPSFSFRVHATRDIKQGEELATPYCNTMNLASDRAKELAPYGIDKCACDACGDTRTSDARRAKIVKKPDAFVTGQSLLMGGAPAMQKAERDILEQIDLLEKESLQAQPCYGTYLNKLSMIYMLQQKADKVQQNKKKLDYLIKAQIGSPAMMMV